jgi:hypothetical protein
MVRLAGGSTVLNYADMAWDGTTFNISTRQSTKNFKVSFGQVAYLEVDSTNVSVQSLRVNQTLEVLGSLIYDDLILNDSLLLNGTLLADGGTFRNDVVFERDVDIEQTLNVSNINVSGNVVVAGTITGSNISTAALIPGTNITITNNVISAFVQSDADIVVSSLHVDNDVDIYGVLNVSETSNFGQSLNVDNQLFVGKAGEIDGNLVLYSTNIGDNFQIQNYSDSATGFIGTGNISRFNFSLLGNQTLTIKPTQVNISGDLIVSGNITGTLDFENLSVTNLSVVNLTVDLIQGDLNAGDMFASSLTTTGHVETGKWLIGASDTVTASLYNKDITSVDTHYALRQTNGGATSLNGTAVYFKNNGTDVGEWTATGLGVGKTNPTSTLDVSGDSFFAGEVDIVGDLTTENISATTLTTTGYVETGKWHLGALNTTTSELYNKDVTSSTTHYAMRQTNGGSTSLNGAEIYFKNNGTVIAEINGTGLGVGKTAPTTTLDVLGNTLITGNVNICGILDADDIVLDNISNTNFSGANMTATELVVPLLSNVSFITSTGMIEFTTNGSPTLDLDELSSKFYHDVNISGTLTADAMANINCVNASFTNVSATNLTVATIGNFSSQNISATTLSTTGHIETGKWLIGASNSTTASLYNTDITSVTTHYALHQTDGGVTSLNGTAVYFKNNGTDVGEWTATGLGIGKTTPTKKLDVLGNSLFTGDINVCGSIYSDIVNTPLVTSNILDLDGTDRILFNINNEPQMELIEDELYLYVDCIAQTMDVQQKLDGLNMSMTNISATQISSNFVLTPTLLNVSYLWSDGTIDFRTNTLPTLAMNNASAKFFQDVNISGTLRADTIEGIDFLNICSTNISTSNLSATHINCSTLILSDTAGDGGLDVNGAAYFRGGFFVYTPVQFESDDNYFGLAAGSSTKSRINFWSQKAAYEVGCRLGCDSDDIVRLKLEKFGLYTQYNINISNVSTMDMDNTSTKFHQNVNISGTLTADNISCANLSTATMEFGSGLTFSLNTLSADFTSVETAIASEIATEVDTSLLNTTTANIGFLKVDGIANISYLNASNVCFTNLSATNLSCTKLTTSGAVGSTSVISGFQIERFSNNVVRILANDDTALLAYNTNTGICAYQGETQVEFRVNGTALLTCKSGGVRIGDNNTPTEILDVNGNALISGELTVPTANIGFLNVDGNANISYLNASNISCINLSATSITAPDVQPTLIAGTNIVISGNTISATGGGTTYTAGNNITIVGTELSTATTINSTTHNVSTVNTSNINVNTKVSTTNISSTNISSTNMTLSGAMTISGALTLSGQARFLAYYAGTTTPLTIATNAILQYDTLKYNIGGGAYTNYTYTVPVTGLYFFMCSFSTNATTCEVYIERNGSSLQRIKKTGATNADNVLFCTVIANVSAGNTIRCMCRVNNIRLTVNNNLQQGVHQFSGTRIA